MVPNFVTGHYDPLFVFLSFLLAQLSAYAALDLTARVASSSRSSVRLAWIGGGATAMGIGIWSMHYVGMLAYEMSMPVRYDWPIVLLSMGVAIGASGLALWLASRRQMGLVAGTIGSLVMGGGIAAMHYIGMAAMRMPAKVTYSVPLVTLSVVLAVGIAFVALRFSYASRYIAKAWTWRKAFSALLMGLAIPVMHYTGMAAASWTMAPMPHSMYSHTISISDVGTCCIAAVTVVMLSLVLLAVVIDRRFSDRAREIENSEERYRKIISAAFDAFIGITPEGRILDWNQQATAAFGWSREEALGRSVSEILLPVLREREDDVLLTCGAVTNALLSEGRKEMRGRHRSGTLFAVETAVSAIQMGNRRLLAAFVHDVTERKAFEQRMEEARRSAEDASRAKSEFLANMSHEIRTPLNGVIGMTELALETELTGEQREYLETAKLSADSLLGVINDILDFSKIEAGKIELERVAFDLRECIESTLKTLVLRADEKGLELLCEIEEDVPEMIAGDPGRVRQVATNLVGNAIKFTDHGEVFVRVAAEDDANAPQLHFMVSDTGIGIDPAKLDRIFGSFNQADTSTTRQYGGTGLGLTISKRLVELMGGRIWVESEPGRGSCFHFTVPMEAVMSAPRREEESAQAVLINIKALIIDDNKTNRRILDGQLTRWGMRTSTAPDGATALSMLIEAEASGDPFELVLTDMHMPRMDGFTVVEELKKRQNSSATVMMLSSGGNRGDANRCKELGVAAYLLKPVRQTELRLAITRALVTSSRQEDRMITQQSLRAERPADEFLNILLAEDNEVNQRLAVRLLEKRGHRIQVAANGRQAVEAAIGGRFDLVLMDVQMPEMDGIEATALIRRSEEGTGRHLPIVAMTALVMKGDRERCLEARMDGYLSKPVRQQELDEVLESFTAQKRTGERKPDVTPEPTALAIDIPDLLARVDGDLAFISELIDVLREDCPRKFEDLRAALGAGDTGAARRSAHSLKGALSNVSAHRAAAFAAKLESLADTEAATEGPRLLTELEAEFRCAVEALTTVCEGQVR